MIRIRSFHLLYNKANQKKGKKEGEHERKKKERKKASGRKERQKESARERCLLLPPSRCPPPSSSTSSPFFPPSSGPNLGDIVVLRERRQMRVERRHAVPVALRREPRYALGLPGRDGGVVPALGVRPAVGLFRGRGPRCRCCCRCRCCFSLVASSSPRGGLVLLLRPRVLLRFLLRFLLLLLLLDASRVALEAEPASGEHSLFLSLFLNGKRLGHEVVVGDQDRDEADGEEVLYVCFGVGREGEGEKGEREKRLSFFFSKKNEWGRRRTISPLVFRFEYELEGYF